MTLTTIDGPTIDGPADIDETGTTSFEGEIREFVRRDFAPLRRLQPEPGSSEFAVANINSLVQRVAGTSIQEIENLISELQALRNYLESEGERVQRELAGYAQLNQAAIKSTKIIAESMAQWKQAVDAPPSA
jgi:dsDNA-specific endonuclease/ATPase MutS2